MCSDMSTLGVGWGEAVAGLAAAVVTVVVPPVAELSWNLGRGDGWSSGTGESSISIILPLAIFMSVWYLDTRDFMFEACDDDGMVRGGAVVVEVGAVARATAGAGGFVGGSVCFISSGSVASDSSDSILTFFDIVY